MCHILKISEIFYSVIGEGAYIGYPAVFIRLAGCSMGCQFCDTKYSWSGGKEMSIEEILDTIKTYPCKRVVITGGEPFEQDIEPLVSVLLNESYKVHIETNGAHSIPNFSSDVWLTVSPKKYWLKENVERANEIKIVITCSEDFRRYKDIINEDVFLVPVSNNDFIAKKIIRYILQNGGRLGWQLQKTLNIK